MEIRSSLMILGMQCDSGDVIQYMSSVRQRDLPDFTGSPEASINDWLRRYEREKIHFSWDNAIIFANVVLFLRDTLLQLLENHKKETISWNNVTNASQSGTRINLRSISDTALAEGACRLVINVRWILGRVVRIENIQPFGSRPGASSDSGTTGQIWRHDNWENFRGSSAFREV